MSVNWLGAPDNAAIALTYVDELPDGGRLSRHCVRDVGGRAATRWWRSCCRLRWALCSRRRACRSSHRGSSGLFGPGVADALASFSLLTHFEAAQRGVLELRALVFYLGFIALWLTLNAIWVSARKGG